MNSTYLRDPIVQAKIHTLWMEKPSLSFFGKLKKCVKFYERFCIRKAEEHKQEEEGLRQQYEALVVMLQNSPNDVGAQAMLANLQHKLQSFEQHKAAGQRLRNRVNWMQAGD